MRSIKKQNSDFIELIKIMRKLLGNKGCPWDREQTHKSLIKYLKKETLELEKAIKNNNYKNMKEELGDILLQVIFHSELARKNKKFSINDVIKELNKKLKRRHPHVFGNLKVKTPEEVIKLWKQIKERENDT